MLILGSNNMNLSQGNLTSLGPSQNNRLSKDSLLSKTIGRVFILSMACLGLIANFIVLIILWRISKRLPKLLVKLLVHQSIVDGFICLFTMITGIHNDTMFSTNIQFLDTVLCYVVNCQVPYWISVSLSTHGLVLLAGERFIAVCKPFKYLYIKDSRCIPAIAFLCIYTFALVVSIPDICVCRYSNGTCLSSGTPEYATSDIFLNEHFRYYFFTILPYVWFIVYYIVPVAAVCVLYALILNALRHSISLSTHSKNKTVANAANEITKTGLTVTILFIVFMGVVMVSNILAHNGVLKYNLTVDTIGMFFTTLNSVVNPFIYVLFMPTFQKCLRRTLCCNRVTILNIGRYTRRDTECEVTAISEETHMNHM